MEKSESIKELAKALCKAQGELGHAKKDSVNPHFRSKYSDISEVIDTIKPVFTANGLSFLQMPSMEGNILTLTTMILHASGEYVSEVAKTPISKQDPQGVGAGITYLRRFALSAFSGLAQEDDDGNTASKPDHDYSPARARNSAPVAQPKPTFQTPKQITADEPPPHTDDDIPDWMLDTEPPAVLDTQEPEKTYHYKPPFDKKDRAKALGCRWNSEKKTWDSKTQIPEFDAYIK
jgi:hypothetical protein